ncbi:MFS transporter [Flavobacterium sp. YJ01]|uniref:MFS transporter n=1 Tax=Flavobacterium sp. YJ01 TaxID=3031997 RepID=UPI0023E360C6|nr:MFS transporter [Flavobacterium sp. YJ01]WET04251.1 MFS transporter [Flavobacterium sp. YJ01]
MHSNFVIINLYGEIIHFKGISPNLHNSTSNLNLIMNEKIKSLQIIHFAICAGTIAAYFFVGEISIEKLQIPAISTLSIIYTLIPILTYIISTFLFRSQIKQIDPKLKLEEKLPFYQAASILRWAILEGAAFILLFLKPDYILFGILIIVYLIFLRPTEERIKNELSDNNF